MTLGDKQREFVRCQGLLVAYAYSLGYAFTMGRGAASKEANEAEGGHKRSTHLHRLGQDWNLFKKVGGRWKYCTETEDHLELGRYWERLHPLATWGGRFGDGNHYSFTHNGIK